MYHFSRDIYSEIVKYLNIDNIRALSSTCQYIYSVLDRKQSDWVKLIKWEVLDIHDTYIHLSRKVGIKKLATPKYSYHILENPIGSEFEALKISYHNVDCEKYYVYIDQERRTIT